jgi:hypothetical protein
MYSTTHSISSEPISPLSTGKRYLGLCYGVDTSGLNGIKSPIMTYRYCKDNFGVGPSIMNHRLGDSANPIFLDYERVVAYVPNPRFRGPDFFTYKVYAGLGVQSHIGPGRELTTVNEVTMHVRYCRKFQSQVQKGYAAVIHPLCSCASSESGIINNITACDIQRKSICAVEGSRDDFLNMCHSCKNLGSLSFECQAETVRAVALLTERGTLSSSYGYSRSI